MAVYFVDYTGGGSPRNSGLSEREPLSRVEDCSPLPGDTVRIKRGSTVRGALHAVSGEKGRPVTYEAYGEGEDPVFCGSVDASDPADWEAVPGRPNLWRSARPFASEPCNLIFNGGESFGNLRWEMEELRCQGEWFDPDGGKTVAGIGYPEGGALFLYSACNPALFYDRIDIALYGERVLCKGTGLVLDHLTFTESGVHGFAGQPEDTVIRNCRFLRIGGCVWDRRQKIRFGNAVELWESAENVTVTNCFFHEIYDSCVTHQGARNISPMRDIHFDGNIFQHYGMAAYELRDLIPVRSSFCDNICIRAGVGFASQGEAPPRRSEIWPQPMGHHLFLWRVAKPSVEGSLEIRHNYFCNAPVGAAVYSIDEPDADRQIILRENVYWTENPALLLRWNRKIYAPGDFARYKKESGQDQGSRYVSEKQMQEEIGGIARERHCGRDVFLH